MKPIAFIDTEIDPSNGKVLDMGGINSNGAKFHSNSSKDLIQFLTEMQYIVGHNFVLHDYSYLKPTLDKCNVLPENLIDTLYLSPLLFPERPYHALLKDDKLQTDELNNPLNDAIKAKELFQDEIEAFYQSPIKEIFYFLLRKKLGYAGFFRYIDYHTSDANLIELVKIKFKGAICDSLDLAPLIKNSAIELAYALSIIQCKQTDSITPRWVLKSYPKVERIINQLRNRPCVQGCLYCNQSLDGLLGLKKFFNHHSFRTYGEEPLQEHAVNAAIQNKSLIAVFPTGGGKSITFQVPALMSGENSKALTVIISPLQSLMKDQVDNLEKMGITSAVTINGLLDPIERSKSMERVENGQACMLYISPESLRSKSIERLLLGRNIARFVIDEAHCFSSWGQDFRVDYLYIADFIKQLQITKNLVEPIQISCFTATAKKKVVEDICYYFKSNLNLDLEIYNSSAGRKNLHYKVYEKDNEEGKYNELRELLFHNGKPCIVYVSRTKKAHDIAERLTKDGFMALPYYGKMDPKDKTANQNAFINGEVRIMVATSAFGMGVDKKDIAMVVHFEISDSLENYVQEAGRAGRDENLEADCYVLFNEDDLSKHFVLLNQTKLSLKEIKQVWKAVKNLSKTRLKFSKSALDIARSAGWDENIREIETRVTTAISALENSGYLKRGQNSPTVYASSILTKNAQEAIETIERSKRFEIKEKEKATRIIKKLFSTKTKQAGSSEVAESRVDYIAETLEMSNREVIHIVNLLREEKILGDTKDLNAFIKKGEQQNKSNQILQSFNKLEKFLSSKLEENSNDFNIKELNEQAEAAGCTNCSPNQLKIILNFWSIKGWIKKTNLEHHVNHSYIHLIIPKEQFIHKISFRKELSVFIISFLYNRSLAIVTLNNENRDDNLVSFSVFELKEEFEKQIQIFNRQSSSEEVEEALFFLSRIDAIKIEGGFMVLYNRLNIERLEVDNKKQYRVEDYQALNQFYENKIQQIHIVGEYAKKMTADYSDALQFVDDYFQLNYSSFLNKYFKGARQSEIKRNITIAKFKQLFGDLSTTQLNIIKDQTNKNILVAAGPGSGKTKVLVHKLASLILMEDIKTEQLLMITFSRAAASEFKQRLIKLIGTPAYFVEIKTFHSYCFDLLGRVGNLEKSGSIIHSTIEKIQSKDIELNKITKTVLVIDESQDINEDEYRLISLLITENEDLRVLMVGDDDQNIFEFRGASSLYMKQFLKDELATKYELNVNYRSKNDLVGFTDKYVKSISNRIKTESLFGNNDDNGTVKIKQYSSERIIVPLVIDFLKSEFGGTTAILTRTNLQALQINTMLNKAGRKSQLIQTNEKFNLSALKEIKWFFEKVNNNESTSIISNDAWNEGYRAFVMEFKRSSLLPICLELLRQFDQVNSKVKYKSDFDMFLQESRLEDFYQLEQETTIISTIHKAKGKEFDNVFILFDGEKAMEDKDKRLLYVGITRAKTHLAFYQNQSQFSDEIMEGVNYFVDSNSYSEPNEISLQFGYKDVWLGFFGNKQFDINSLVSGDKLKCTETSCFDNLNHEILRFSEKGKAELKKYLNKGYQIESAKINFVIWWKAENASIPMQIILPEILLIKDNFYQ
ncbi:MAG: RecQ family ATP-dependent DNA helicase [bacterium]|nr:RecQ family ATP-dependent DNA helicase [bacterium]